MQFKIETDETTYLKIIFTKGTFTGDVYYRIDARLTMKKYCELIQAANNVLLLQEWREHETKGLKELTEKLNIIFPILQKFKKEVIEDARSK